MRTLYSIVIILLSCQTKAQLDFYNCPINSKPEYSEKAKLERYFMVTGKDTSFRSWQIDTGNHIVFKYKQDYNCDPTFHLAVYTNLLWAIPPDKTSFTLTFSSLDSLQYPIIYKTGCGPPCRIYNFDMLDANGFIMGEKKNDTWIVTGSIKMKLYNSDKNQTIEKDLRFEKEFTKWKKKRKVKNYRPFSDY